MQKVVGFCERTLTIFNLAAFQLNLWDVIMDIRIMSQQGKAFKLHPSSVALALAQLCTCFAILILQ